MIPFQDISYVQGYYNMAANNDQIIAIRMSSGEGGLHFDSQAARNYKNASAAGKVIINYHFAGGGDPTAEANFFIEAVSPFAENDVYALDHELGQSAEWCQTFMDVVHNTTGAWPLDYENIGLANSMGPRPNCGLWLAAPSWGFNQPITELNGGIIYVAQQGPIVNGVDSDMWFGIIEELKAYGYHAQTISNPPAPPAPAPTQPAPTPPTPAPGPVPPTPTPPTPPSPPAPTPPEVIPKPPTPKPPVQQDPVKSSNWFTKVINWINKQLAKLNF